MTEDKIQKKTDILEKGAIVQRDRETYAVTPRIPCGVINDFQLLRTIADVAERYGAQTIKVTSSQRLAIIGIKQEDLDAVWAELGMTPGYAYGLCIRSIKACPGTAYCRLGQQDALGLGLEIERRYANMATPNKFKISISGCPMDCSEGHLRDLGIIGSRKGYTVELGGSGGPHPRIAEPVATELSPDETLDLVGRIVEAYKGLEQKQRIGKAIERMGLGAFREKIGL